MVYSHVDSVTYIFTVMMVLLNEGRKYVLVLCWWWQAASGPAPARCCHPAVNNEALYTLPEVDIIINKTYK